MFYELPHPYIYEDPVFQSFYIVAAEPRDLLFEPIVSSSLGTHSGDQSGPPAKGLDHIPEDGTVFAGNPVDIDISGDSSLRSFPKVIVISVDDEDPEDDPKIVEILSSNSES
ncbi:hypothetical protein AHAS_Ahas17G0221800 [Arachis hypogaea]